MGSAGSGTVSESGNCVGTIPVHAVSRVAAVLLVVLAPINFLSFPSILQCFVSAAVKQASLDRFSLSVKMVCHFKHSTGSSDKFTLPSSSLSVRRADETHLSCFLIHSVVMVHLLTHEIKPSDKFTVSSEAHLQLQFDAMLDSTLDLIARSTAWSD
jgi:hypothetical protein